MRSGDVVVLHSPTHPGDVLVKRVIAVESDRVERKGDDGRSIIVPRGHFWVEGDNVKSSRDSNLFGAVGTSTLHTLAACSISYCRQYSNSPVMCQ